MGQPLVSVLVIAYRAESTLEFALLSVLAQTVSDWECIVVDDGSPLSAEPHVSAVDDSRFRFVRYRERRGRGYARQRALEIARGRFVAILDADDWMYPSRIERQLSAMLSDSAISLVGCSMAVERAGHHIVGIVDAKDPADRALGRMPFSFAPILVRAEVAHRIGFDSRLTRSEDVAFMARALTETWAHVAAPLYAYCPSSPSRSDSLEGYRCSGIAYRSLRDERPMRARTLELGYGLRALAHAVCTDAMSRRLTEWARARTLRAPDEVESEQYDSALSAVGSAGKRPAVASSHPGKLDS